jgi:hypothetical protein
LRAGGVPLVRMLGFPAQFVFLPEEKAIGIRSGGQRRRVRRVVLAAGSLAAGRERGVEVVGRSLFPLAGRDQPRDGVIGHPDGATPSLNLHLEQDLVVDGRDTLAGSAVVGEALAGLGQKRMRYLIQRHVGRRHCLHEVLAQAT